MKKLLFAIMFMVLHTFSVSELFANDSYSPLFKAIQEDDLNKVKELIAAGADVNEHWRGTTPLMNAVAKGKYDDVKYDIVKELIKNGANINENFANPSFGQYSNVFFGTVAMRDVKVLELLANSGGNINLQDKDGRTPLIYAISEIEMNGYHAKEYMEIIKKLVDLGADVNLKDKDGYPPILHTMHSLSGESHEILKTLLEAGADVNTKSPYYVKFIGTFNDRIGWIFDAGATPLLIAAGYNKNDYSDKYHDIRYIDTLLSCGAQLNAKDSKGRNAILYAMYSQARVNEYDIESMIKTINKLLTLKLDINDKDNFGRTALHYACFTKNTYTASDPNWKDASSHPLIKMLLDSGADINAKDNDGKTALMLAAEDDKADTVSYLLAQGANPHIKSKNGKTALDLARENEAVDAFWALKPYYQ